MYREDFRRLINAVGCADARVLRTSPITLQDPEIERRIGMVGFASLTIRAFKLALEDRCEDYGQVATYLGSMAEHPHAFELDDHHRFLTDKPMLVCGNTADMLTQTRYARHFRVLGDKHKHLGLFDCAPETGVSSAAGACC